MNIIYSIHCPISDEPKYIGKTTRSVELRFSEHLNGLNKKSRAYCKLYVWLRELKAKGLKPYYVEVDRCESDIDFWEMHYISLFKSWGFSLLNMTNGGDGGSLDDDTRKRISNTLKGRKLPMSVVAKISKYQRGRKKINKTNYTSQHSRKTIQIGDKIFTSYKEAVETLGISRTTLHRHYTLKKKPRDLSIEYNGVVYSSVRRAANDTGIGRYIISKKSTKIYAA